MGKIFKALEKSETEHEDLRNRSTKVKSDFDIEHIDNIKTIEKEDRKTDNSVKPELNPHKNLITVNRPHSVEAEQFRLIKNSILFPDSGTPPKTIMITSADQSEGKSFVAANLAASIALSIDEYVLLMDCDLRHPTVHSMFGIENSKGLSAYLQEEIPLSSVLVKTFLDKLTILPGGTPPLNPSELVSSEQMRRLVEEAKNRYDDRYILLDAPPPYMTSETNALATYVDGIILVVRHGFTNKGRFKDIVDIYGKEKIIGVVKNFSRGKFGTGYGYKKRYEYGNNKKGRK